MYPHVAKKERNIKGKQCRNDFMNMVTGEFLCYTDFTLTGKGFSVSNLYNMRLFYMHYQKFQTVSGKLSWSHYCELLTISDPDKRGFYEIERFDTYYFALRATNGILAERGMRWKNDMEKF